MNSCRRYAGLALLVQLAAACSSEPSSVGNAALVENRTDAAPAPAAPQADRRLVLAFGDSLYAGYQLGPNEGFAPVLERALGARGVVARVVNAGVSGDTSAAGLQRLAFALDGLDRAPDLVLVGLGANDALRGLSPAETRRNLDAILAELARREIPAMLTGMMAPRNLGADYAGRFDAIYPELARAHGAELYPFFLEGIITRPELLLADGMHPNARGVEMIADRIAPIAAARLQREDG
jgi:acyl-CoA thioesterase-1